MRLAIILALGYAWDTYKQRNPEGILMDPPDWLFILALILAIAQDVLEIFR